MDHLPIDGPWSIGEGEREGKVLIVRFNTGYRDLGRVASYDHQVGVAVPLRAPEPTGLPSAEEDAQLGDLEDSICASLEAEAESLLVAIVTGAGMKELVFYTRAPDGVRQRLELLRESVTSHEIHLMIQPDKDWRVYAELA